MWTEEIILEHPYAIEEVLYRLSLDPLNQVNLEGKEIKVPLFVGNKKVIATVQSTGTMEKPVFHVRAEDEKEWVISRLRDIFQWDTSFDDIYTHFQGTIFEPLMKEFSYTPLVLEFHPFECLMRCIIHQQLNLKFAHVLTERFVKTYGEEVDGVYFSPIPERVAIIPIEELREMQFSTRKAEYLIGLAKEIVEGRLQLDELSVKLDEEIEKILLNIRGIGPWTVQNFLMFALGRENMFPVGDVGIQNALKRLYCLDDKPTKQMLEQIQEICSPYGSYAALYLWKSLEK